MCPCIFFHGFVLRGFLFQMDPSALWNFEPTRPGPPEKLCLFMAQANPFHFDTPMTFTSSIPSRMSRLTTSHFFKSLSGPESGTSRMVPFSTISKATASYPSFSIVLICAILNSGIFMSVTGMSLSPLMIRVISNFFPRIQAIV